MVATHHRFLTTCHIDEFTLQNDVMDMIVSAYSFVHCNLKGWPTGEPYTSTPIVNHQVHKLHERLPSINNPSKLVGFNPSDTSRLRANPVVRFRFDHI